MNNKMHRVESPFFRLELPSSGIYYCLTMAAVYSVLSEYYPELVRSKSLRVGKKNIGDRRVIKMPSGKEIILTVIPLLKMEGRTYKGRKDLGNVGLVSEAEPKKEPNFLSQNG